MQPKYFAALTLSLAAFLPGTAPAQTGTPLLFVPVTPCRVVDTRLPNGLFGSPELAGNSTRDFSIPGSSCGIPSNAAAYSLNVTVVPDGKLGWLTIWPTGQPVPVSSTLNSDGRIKANAAIVPAGANGGSVSVFVTDPTQLIIDIDGYFIPDQSGANGLQFFPLAPCRVADTRGTGGSLMAGGTQQFGIIGNCGIPSTAQAFSLNFTAVPPGRLTYVTVWPSSQPEPNASTLNASTGAITANAAIVPAGTNGIISVFSSDNTDLVIDVNGYFAPSTTGGLDLFTVTPCRVLDTRNGGAGSPFNGELTVNVTGSSCAPSSAAQAFVFNATVVPPGPLTWLNLWPDGQPVPVASALNANDGAITSNMAIVPSSNGSIDAFGSNPTHLILDISGYFAPSSGGGGGGGMPPPPPCSSTPCAFIGGTSVGQNLQALVPVTLSPTPTSNTLVTVISYSPNVLVSDHAGGVGGSSAVVSVLAGSDTIGVYVQALSNSGTAVIGATAPGYGEGEATVNLFPSAFILSTPTGVGNAFNVGVGGTAQLTVTAAMLNASGQFVAIQQVRAGANPSVSISVGDPSVGSVSPSSVSFSAADTQMLAQFTGGSNQNASTTITLNEPSGFSAPADGTNHAQVTLQPNVLNCTGNIAIGFNLAAQGVCTIAGGAPTDEVLTLTSNNPAALLFAPANFSVAPSASISLTMAQGSSSTPPFLLVGAASSGIATYTVTSALGNATPSITLLPTAFILNGPTGVANSFSTTFPGADVAISVEAHPLSGSGLPLAALPLAPGVTASVNVSSNSNSVGQIAGSPAVITGGNYASVVYFHPTGMGTATISAAVPSGGYASAGGSGTLTANVGTPSINISVPGSAVGQNLEEEDTIFLSAAPATDLTVMLQASGSIKLSANGNDAGSTTLPVTVPAGQNSAVFWIYGQASSGPASIAATAPGYNSAGVNVALGQSAFVVVGLSGTSLLTTPLASGPQPLAVTPAVLDGSGNYLNPESLAGSAGAVTVMLNNQNSNAGTLPTSVVVPVGGVGSVTFTPTHVDQTIITAVAPTGYVSTAGGSSPGSRLTITVQ